MPPYDYFKAGSEQVLSLFEEIQHTSDRIAAVSAAAFVDDTLAHVMMAHFIRLGKSWEDKLFHGPSSPLGTFSAKITLGYAMGIFGPLTRADLDIIRSVRNDFAHSAMPMTFSDADVSEKCNKLTTPGRIVHGFGIM